MTFSLVKQSSALVPLAMSIAALALLLGNLALFGVARRAGDEGAAARKAGDAGAEPLVALLSPGQWASPFGLGFFFLTLNFLLVCAGRLLLRLVDFVRCTALLTKDLPRNLPSLQQVGGLLVALGVSAGILLAQDQIRRLEGLGYPGAFLMMLLLSAALFLPSPTLVFNVVLGQALPDPLLAGVAIGLGSALGEMTGYVAGRSGNPLVTNTRAYRSVEKAVHRYGLPLIVGLSLVPNPLFDVAGVVAGALGIGWVRFLLATAAGKTVRAIAIAYVGASLLR